MKSFFTTLTFIIFCSQTYSQPGSPDVSFGEKGKVISNTYSSFAYAGLLQPDGKIIVGGNGSYDKGGSAISGSLLARYSADGSLDISFGDSGRAAYNLGHPVYSSENIYAIALQKEDKIVAAMYGYNSIAVMRINEDGSVDESFGEAGLALGNEDHKYSATDMALLPDGRIIITGNISDFINDDNRGFIACFTPDGSPDKSFGEDGVVTFTLSSSAIISASSVTKEGKIVIGGEYRFDRKIILLRYNNDGTHDDSFGMKRMAELAFDLTITTPSIRDIIIANDNSISTAGVAYPNNSVNASLLVSRFKQNGLPDSSFGTNGYTITTYENADAHANAVTVQTNGKVIVCGYALRGETAVFTLARYDKDGILDSAFGSNGIQNIYFYGQDESRSVLVQSDGRIVVSGFSQILSEDKYVTTLTRYYGDDNKKQIIVARIRRWLQHHGITWQRDGNVRYYTVQRSTDGGITWQPVAKLYNNKPFYNYEDAAAQTTNSNTCYRLSITTKNGEHLVSNTVFIEETDNAKVYPNPVRGTMQLQGLPTDSKTNISILDFNGNVRTTATASGSNASVNTFNLAPGNYLLKLQHNNSVTTQAFVKE